MKKIFHYLKYYLAVAKLSYMSSAMYRADHLLRYFRIILEFSISVLTINTLFVHSKSLAGWSKAEVFMIYSIWLFIVCLYHFFTSGSNYQTNREIRKGNLDLLLTKPIDSQFSASFRQVHIDNIFRVLGCVIIFLYAFSQLKLHPNLLEILLFILQMIGGVAIYYSFAFWAVILTFATQGSEQIAIFDSINGLGKYPADIYPKKVIAVFFSVIPLAYFSLIPALTLLGRSNVWLILMSLVAPFIFLILTRVFWLLSLRTYSSASS